MHIIAAQHKTSIVIILYRLGRYHAPVMRILDVTDA